MSALTLDQGVQVRSLAILGTYLVLAGAITVWLGESIWKKYVQCSARLSLAQRVAVSVFTVQAVASLAFTWTYMGAFFRHSYRAWELQQKALLPLGMAELARGVGALTRISHWLSDSQLFKEAWGQVVQTPTRYWWSQQIFLSTALWSIFLGVEGKRYQISLFKICMFMLLGQIVAISFAQNLFYLNILLESFGKRSTTIRVSAWRALIYYVGFALAFVAIYVIPERQTHLLFTLLVPHLIFFGTIVPPYSGEGRPSKLGSGDHCGSVYQMVTALSVGFHAMASYHAWKYLGQSGNQVDVFFFLRSLQETLYEHPAVSSVGWDVIMSIGSYLTWSVVGRPAKVNGTAVGRKSGESK